LISGEIVDLVLHVGVKTGDSVDEHLDDVVKNLVLFLSSGLLSSVSFSEEVEVVDGVVQGVGGFEVNLPSFIFVSLGGDDGDKELVLIGDLGSLFFVQMFEFQFGVGQPGNEVPGSLYFVLLKVSDRVDQVLFESVDHIDHLLSDGSLVSTGLHSFELKSVLSVIVGLSVPFGGFGVDSLSFLS